MLSRRDAIGLGAAAMLAANVGGTASPPTLRGTKPLVFAHRGSSALRPEHTLAAYEKAIADGADFIEPDLVVTKDGILVARHENEISGTTDVASHPDYANRRTTKIIDGESITGWFTEDFTLAELKALRAIERLGAVRPESQEHDGQYPVPTFDELIAFTAAEAERTGRMIGIVPELKHSTYFASIGLPLEEGFLATLAAHDYTQRCPVEIQSFEVANLRALRQKIGRPANVTLLQLFGPFDSAPADIASAGGSTRYADMATRAGFAEIAAYADVVGPSTRSLIPVDADGRLSAPTSFVTDAHKAGLLVRPYTFRPENRFLPAELRSADGQNARHEAGSIAEIRRCLALGIDGFFTDDPALGRMAVDGA